MSYTTTEERTAFEVWCIETERPTEKDTRGLYVYADVEAAWLAWLARARWQHEKI